MISCERDSDGPEHVADTQAGIDVSNNGYEDRRIIRYEFYGYLEP